MPGHGELILSGNPRLKVPHLEGGTKHAQDDRGQCERLARNFCDWTKELRGLAIRRSIRARELREQEQVLEDIGITRRELQAFMNTPDTGSLLDEALRQRRIAQAKRNLLQILRRVRRNPLIAIDVTVAALKGEATRQLESLTISEARVLASVRLLRDEVRDIDGRIDDIESLMAEAGRRAAALGCDPGRTLRAC